MEMPGAAPGRPRWPACSPWWWVSPCGPRSRARACRGSGSPAPVGLGRPVDEAATGPAPTHRTPTRSWPGARRPASSRRRRPWSPSGPPSSWPARSSSAATTAPTRRRPPDLVRDLHLAGVCVDHDNVVDGAQVRATTAAVSKAHAADAARSFPPVIGVDQEGGWSRTCAASPPTSRPSQAPVRPSPPVRDRASRRSPSGRATPLELRQLGFTWVFAPVADVTIGAADPDDRLPVALLGPGPRGRGAAAAVEGYDAAGLVSTTKHFPGHGGATADSHDVLPVLDASLEDAARPATCGRSRRPSTRAPRRS